MSKIPEDLLSLTTAFSDLETGSPEGHGEVTPTGFILSAAQQKNIDQARSIFDAMGRNRLRETLRAAKSPSDFVNALNNYLDQSKVPEVYQKHIQQVKDLVKEFAPKLFAAEANKVSATNVKEQAEFIYQAESVLVCACTSSMHNSVLVEALLEANVNPNERDTLQQTGLMHAAAQYNLEIFKKLIEAEGIDINLQGKSGVTALIIVARSKYTGDGSMAGNSLWEMLNLLLQREANPDLQQDGKSALDYAVQANNLKTVSKLIKVTSSNRFDLQSLVNFLLTEYGNALRFYQKTLASYTSFIRQSNTSAIECTQALEAIKHLRLRYESTFSYIQYCLERINEKISAKAKVAAPMRVLYSEPPQEIVTSVKNTLKQLKDLMPEFAQAKEENRLSTCDI